MIFLFNYLYKISIYRIDTVLFLLRLLGIYSVIKLNSYLEVGHN